MRKRGRRWWIAGAAALWLGVCGFSLFGGAARAPVVTFGGSWPTDAVAVSDCHWRDERILCQVRVAAGHSVPADSLAVKVLDAHGVRVAARTFPDVALEGGERAYLVAYAGGMPLSRSERVTLAFQAASDLYWTARGLQGELKKRLQELLQGLDAGRPPAPR